jgi:AbrB family looped-hinge helix DNA binding protein
MKRGTTNVPKSIRDALGMQPGDTLEWQVTGDGTVLCRHKPAGLQRAAVALVRSKLAGQ